ncbi:MAG TPA: Rid family hydrolase [Chloroflexia bacterium]|nr:Rid family hydrolase [Chloroflexia bacterium]
MQYRFTQQAMEAMQTAQKLMFSKSHTQLDVEHVLLALLQQRNSLPAQIIAHLGGDVRAMVGQLESALNKMPSFSRKRSTATGYITLRCARALQGSADEADRLGDEYIDTLHLLLGVIEIGNGAAGSILQSSSITQEKVLAALQEMDIHAQQEGEEQSTYEARPAKSVITPSSLSRPVGFSHGILPTGGWLLFLAGQTALDAEGKVVARGDVVAQYRQVLSNLRAVVEQAGGEMQNIVKMTIFVQDRDDYKAHLKELGAVHKMFFGAYYPAAALLEVSRFFDDGVMVEIEGIAVLGAGEG